MQSQVLRLDSAGERWSDQRCRPGRTRELTPSRMRYLSWAGDGSLVANTAPESQGFGLVVYPWKQKRRRARSGSVPSSVEDRASVEQCSMLAGRLELETMQCLGCLFG